MDMVILHGYITNFVANLYIYPVQGGKSQVFALLFNWNNTKFPLKLFKTKETLSSTITIVSHCSQKWHI